MAAGRRDLQRTLGVRLTADVGKIHRVPSGPPFDPAWGGCRRDDGVRFLCAAENIDHLPDAANRKNFNVWNQGSLRSIHRRYDQSRNPKFSTSDSCRQDSCYMSQITVQCQFTDKSGCFDFCFGDLNGAIGNENAKRNR